MSQHPDRTLAVRAAQINDGSVGTALQIQLPTLRKRPPCRCLVVTSDAALLVSRHEPIAGRLEGRRAGVVKPRPDFLLPEMVETLIEILRPVFPRRRKDGRDAQRETTADDLPKHIRMGMRSLEARIVVELGISRTSVLPPMGFQPLAEPAGAQGGTDPRPANRSPKCSRA